MLSGETDGRVGVQDAKPHDGVRLELSDLSLDLVSVRDEKGCVVKNRGTDEGRADDSDVAAFHGLVVVLDHLPPRDKTIPLVSPPPDLVIDDPDLMTLHGEPLHEVMALVRPDLHPVRLLNYENFHSIF